MKIFAINAYNNFPKVHAGSVIFSASKKQDQKPDTFKRSKKPEDFYTLSKLAHSGQDVRIQELFRAQKYSPQTLVEILLMQDKNGRTPLHKALYGASLEGVLNYKQGELEDIVRGDKALEKRLVEVGEIRENIEDKPQYFSTVQTMLEPFSNNAEVLKRIFSTQDNEGQTLLNSAVTLKNGYLESMLCHFGNHTNALKEVLLNREKYNERTLLHSLVENSEQVGTISAILLVFKDDPVALRELVMAQDWAGNTPVHFAIINNRPKNLEVLLKALKDNPKDIKDALLSENKNKRTPFNYVKFDDDEISQVVLSYVKI